MMASPTLYRDMVYDDHFFCVHCSSEVHLAKSIDTEDPLEGFEIIHKSEEIAKNMDMLEKCSMAGKINKIYNNLSTSDSILCEGCSDMLLNELNNDLVEAEDDTQQYQEGFHKSHITYFGQKITFYSKMDSLGNEYEALKIEESKLRLKEKKLQEKLEKLSKRNDNLIKEEEGLLKQCNKLVRDCLSTKNLEEWVKNALNEAEEKLEKLNFSSVFKVTFVISTEEDIAVINSYRLGKLPDVFVSFFEINCAWGQTALLLHALAKKSHFPFKSYKVVPSGSASYIISFKEGNAKLPLYLPKIAYPDDEIQFDYGMAAFLHTFEELQSHALQKGMVFDLPYKMEYGKIWSDKSIYTIKKRLNSELLWTTALKMMLENMEVALTHVS